LLPLLLRTAVCRGFIFFPGNIFYFFSASMEQGGTPTLSGSLSFPLLLNPGIVSIHFRLHSTGSHSIPMRRGCTDAYTRESIDPTRLDSMYNWRMTVVVVAADLQLTVLIDLMLTMLLV
jgi:hypothetical protein